jgi:Flp pilus assembly pilin Flp
MLVREEAQTMAEYAVVLAVITVAIVASFTLLSGAIASAYQLVANVFS